MAIKFSPLEVFSQFAPNSRGDLKLRSDLTINNIINIFPLLTKLSLHQKNNKTKIIKINSIPKNFKDLQKCNELKVLLDNYGSDKSNRHNYHYLYSHILNNKNLSSFTSWGKTGIRAQLIDIKNKKLEMDFKFEGDEKSFHVLNAVSPAFTCAEPFSKLIVKNIKSKLN